MIYLLDTNTFWWAATSPRKLSHKARRICESPTARRLVSVASLWELIAKCSSGKLSIPDAPVSLPAWVVNLDARLLPVEAAHVYAVYSLPLLHKDPFDRILVAQAVAEDLTLVTSDEAVHLYPVNWVW